MIEAPRILVVEDEAVVALDIGDRLRRLGYEVAECVDTYAGALDRVAHLRPDLVLMDISLREGRDGIAAAERLRADHGIPVVFLTAYADPATLERAQGVSPYGYVLKPFDEGDLRAKIETALHSEGLDRVLRRGHEEVMAILELQRSGILLLDASGLVGFANQAARRMLDGEGESLVGLPWTDAIALASEDRERLETMLRSRPEVRHPVVAALSERGRRDWVVEIDVQDDPRAPERRILALTDVTEVHDLRRILETQSRFHDVVGRSDGMGRVMRLVRDLARVDVTVLMEGETGTGKSLLGRVIHAESGRREGPFITVNCAGLPEEVIASELFGHRRGAFPGAGADTEGAFEAASGGTLFLDEIADLPAGIQTTLLRVVEERFVMRLGETRPREIDARIIAATNRDLAREVSEGRFRADLLYRIRIGRIPLPPLRARRDDVPLLVRHLLGEQRTLTGRAVDAVDADTMRAMIAYDWPGNVRELKHALAFAVIHCRGDTIELEDLPQELLEKAPSIDA